MGTPIVTNPAGTVPPPAPGIKNTEPNHFEEFFIKLGHGIKDIFKWAPTIGKDTVAVIDEAETLTPEFKAALSTFIQDGAAIAAAAASAAATKGLNITSDYNVLSGIEKIVKDFNTFYPILESAIADLEGVVKTSTPPIPAATVSALDAKIENEVSTEGAATTTESSVGFTPKTPTPITT